MAVRKEVVASHGHVADGHAGRGNVAVGYGVLLEYIVLEWNIGQIAVGAFGRMVVRQTGHMAVEAYGCVVVDMDSSVHTSTDCGQVGHLAVSL